MAATILRQFPWQNCDLDNKLSDFGKLAISGRNRLKFYLRTHLPALASAFSAL
jgi:hypothetical protein